MINIFSTATHLEQLSLDINEIKDYCYETRERLIGRNISNKGGWQSNNLSGVILPLNELFVQITENGNKFANQMGYKNKFKISEIWININPPGTSHNSPHIHPNSIISGTYYLTSHKDGKIRFKNPNPNFLYHVLPWGVSDLEKNTEYTNSNYWFEPRENQLLLFPSYVEHYVEPHQSEYDRISISFNLNNEVTEQKNSNRDLI